MLKCSLEWWSPVVVNCALIGGVHARSTDDVDRKPFKRREAARRAG